MFKLLSKFNDLRKDTRGATAIEYALIAVLLAIIIIAGINGSTFGTNLQNTFVDLGGALADSRLGPNPGPF